MTTVRYEGGIPKVLHDEIEAISSTAINLTAASTPTVLCNALSNPITVNLPSAPTCEGVMYTIKKLDISANTVTILPSGSDKIDGASTYVISQQFLTVSIQSDGSAWFILEVSNTDVNGEVTARMNADSTLQSNINAITINSYGVTANASILINDEVFADTTSGIITLTLPASPVTGNRVRVLDPKGTWGTNKCIIARNGNKIAGYTSDLELTIPADSVELVFYSATSDWRLVQ
jgi:hypothetical protein